MKLVFKPHNSVEAHVISHRLEQEGIKTNVSGDALSGARGATVAYDQSAVWVLDDNDAERAKELIQEWEQKD